MSVSYLALVGRCHDTISLFVRRDGHGFRREKREGDDVAGEGCQRQASQKMNNHFSCPRFVSGNEAMVRP